MLAPQREIADIAEEECRKRKWPCRVIYCVNNSVAVEFAKKYKEEGIKVFISRGGMAKAVEREAGISVVPIEISFQDIAEAVTQAKTLGDRVGISINTVLEYDLNRIRDMFRIEVEIIRTAPNGLLIDAIQKAKSDGYDVIVGGVAPVYFAQQEGMKTVSLRSGRDSVFTAIERAMVRARGSDGLEMFRSLQEGIIILDQTNDVFYINDSACRMMAADKAAILNKRQEDVLPMLSPAGKTKEEPYGIYTAFSFRKKCFLQTHSPFYLGGSFVGKLIQIYDSDVIEMLHSRMRNYSSGGRKTAKYMFSDIITRNGCMKKLIRQADLYAKTNSTILITGETGTGKELLAQSIHNAGYRRDQPFIAVNCSAIPESILESELFGYEPGAFTGALRSGKKGLFEAAEGGTIFLDEIGELPAQLQAKLLRVLQEKEIMRIGGSEAIPVRVRVIAATLADLEEKMEKGTFRRDLYYRLNILSLHIPPLRERPEDIPLLIQYLTDKISHRLQIGPPDFSEEEIRLFQECPWEGNVRELENILERIAVLNSQPGEGIEYITEEILSEKSRKNSKTIPYMEAKKNIQTLEETERQMILEAMRRNGWNKEKAAGELGISVTTLWRRMKEWKIQNEK